jgi:hypothetical protein
MTALAAVAVVLVVSTVALIATSALLRRQRTADMRVTAATLDRIERGRL